VRSMPSYSKPTTMKVSFLDGPSLADTLHSLMPGCTQLDVAMAYVKIGGLRTLLRAAGRLNRHARMRVVFGLSSRQGITDVESAERLLGLPKERNATVRKWNHSWFHPKLFIFHGDQPCIVVGSANLTVGAQTDNAEANLLVKNPDREVFKDALDFFELYFRRAKPLKREHVTNYAREYQKRSLRKRNLKVKSVEDSGFPRPSRSVNELRRMRPRRIWKISPGENARHWNQWLDVIDDDGKGLVALGWDIGHLRKFRSKDSVKAAVTKKVPSWERERRRQGKKERVNIEHVTGQLWAFKTEISRGDVFIVYSATRVLGIAEVMESSDYTHFGNKTLEYANQRSVMYRWFRQWPERADRRIVRVLGLQGTLRLVKKDWVWDHLLETLR
jgi:HKD family nuclease